jgi:hypothetical protein
MAQREHKFYSKGAEIRGSFYQLLTGSKKRVKLKVYVENDYK